MSNVIKIKYQDSKGRSAKEFASISHQLFTTSGYDDPEKIMQLIHDIKQELAMEREQRLPKEEINA